MWRAKFLGLIALIIHLSVTTVLTAAVIPLNDYNYLTVNDGALFRYYDSNNATGSGNFQPFLRFTADGYNSDAPNPQLEYGTVGGVHTHSIKLTEIPIVIVDSVPYLQFLLDANQSQKSFLDRWLSLDTVVISLQTDPNLTGYEGGSPPDFPGDGDGQLVFSLSDSIIFDSDVFNAGSGEGDLEMLIPTSLIPASPDTYLYLWVQTGLTTSYEFTFEGLWEPDYIDQTITVQSGNSASYEEWGVQKVDPQVGSLKITKVVDWNGVTPDANQTFEIWITGPSYPGGDSAIVGYNGGTATWNNLIPGDYTITETDPGTQWTVVISGSPATVVADETTEATVTNTHKLSSLEVTKTVNWGSVTPDANQTFEICITGPSYPSGDCQTIDYDGGVLTWNDLIPGSYTITETDPGSEWAVLVSGSPTTVVGGDTAQASVTNTRLLLGTIIVEKQTDPNDDPNTFTFTGDAAGNIADNGQIVVTNLSPGTYTSTELVPSGWVLTSITVDDNDSSVDVNDHSVEFLLEADETIKAVFTNTKLGKIIVEKQTDPNGDPNTFCFVGDASGEISDDGQIVVCDLLPGTYSSKELVPPGWALTSITVDDNDSTVDVNDHSVEFNLEAGETIKAVFTNTKLGKIIVEKQTDPNGDPNTFCFVGDASGEISDDGQIVVCDLLPGTYCSKELVPPGWALTSITVDDNDSTVDVNDHSVEFKLGVGETIKAVFTNTKLGKIIVEKAVDPNCQIICCDPNFTFGGDVAGTIKEGEQIVVCDLLPGTYCTTEIPTGDWVVQSITVDDSNSCTLISEDGKSGTVIFHLEAGETIKAVFTNGKPPMELSISSSAGGHVTWPGEGDFTYCQGTGLCLEAKVTDPLFKFIGWRGTLFTSAPGIVDPNIPATNLCGDPLDFYPATVSADCTYLELTSNHRIRAAFESLLDVIYVDDNAPNDVGPYDPNVSDPLENGTAGHPFDSIQEAIEVAAPGSTVKVMSGTYSESLDFLAKSIKVISADPNGLSPASDYPVIEAQEDAPVVVFHYNNDPNTLLKGFVLTGGNGKHACGVYAYQSRARVENCLIVGNRHKSSTSLGGGGLWITDSQITLMNCTVSDNYGGTIGAGLYAHGSSSQVVVLDSILWNNLPVEVLTDGLANVTMQTSDITGAYSGPGNLSADPVFVLPGHWEHALNPGMIIPPSQFYAVWVAGDYHLDRSSPCIDAGDPLADYSQEPVPNGAQVNMGAYGNTSQATETP